MSPKKSKKTAAPGRYLISLRTSHEMARKLQAAAIASERGLAAEAEARIEWTFRLNEKSELDALRLKYGPLLGVLMLAGNAAVFAGVTHHAVQTVLAEELRHIVRDHSKGVEQRADILMKMVGGDNAWLSDAAAYRKAVAAAVRVLEAFKPDDDGAIDRFPQISPNLIADESLTAVQTHPDMEIIRSLLGDLINRLPPPTAESAPRSPPDPE
jgi:hypothetical protein